jgi:hypothetical protein
MNLDFWTRAMLTLIAVSLAVIAWKLPMLGASYAQVGCGMFDNPCFISTGELPLRVSVQTPSAPSSK